MATVVVEVAGATQFTGASAADGLLALPDFDSGGRGHATYEIYFLTYHGTGTAPTFTLKAVDTANAGNEALLFTGTANDFAELTPFEVPPDFDLKFETTGKSATGWLSVGYRQKSGA